MRSFACLALAVATVALSACATPSESPSQPAVQSASAPAGQVCSRETKLGSNIPVTVCRSAQDPQ
jgi:hypothetical protein